MSLGDPVTSLNNSNVIWTRSLLICKLDSELVREGAAVSENVKISRACLGVICVERCCRRRVSDRMYRVKNRESEWLCDGWTTFVKVSLSGRLFSAGRQAGLGGGGCGPGRSPGSPGNGNWVTPGPPPTNYVHARYRTRVFQSHPYLIGHHEAENVFEPPCFMRTLFEFRNMLLYWTSVNTSKTIVMISMHTCITSFV